jgi:hypothetical protein
MLIDVGPATIVVNGEKGGMSYPFDPADIQACITTLLSDVTEALPVLKQKAFRIKNAACLSEPARRMVTAVKMVDQTSLTPMAAVAGVVADMVKEYLSVEELDFISVNNGGDISVRNSGLRTLRIAIGDINRNSPTPFTVSINGLVDFGVASSGFGGRSFTLGLADIVTVVSSSAALADAAATLICNRTTVDSSRIVRRKASEIDPLSDIPDELVTIERGELRREEIETALVSGKEAAANLKAAGLIMDAVIILNEQMASTIDEKSNLTLEVSHGNQEDRDSRGRYSG